MSLLSQQVYPILLILYLHPFWLTKIIQKKPNDITMHTDINLSKILSESKFILIENKKRIPTEHICRSFPNELKRQVLVVDTLCFIEAKLAFESSKRENKSLIFITPNKIPHEVESFFVNETTINNDKYSFIRITDWNNFTQTPEFLYCSNSSYINT